MFDQDVEIRGRLDVNGEVHSSDCCVCINVVEGGGVDTDDSHACVRMAAGNRNGSQRAQLSALSPSLHSELLFLCDNGGNGTGAGHVEPWPLGLPS